MLLGSSLQTLVGLTQSLLVKAKLVQQEPQRTYKGRVKLLLDCRIAAATVRDRRNTPVSLKSQGLQHVLLDWPCLAASWG